jgi:hypothetical protein
MLCRVAKLAVELLRVALVNMVVALSRGNFTTGVAIPLLDRHPGAIVKRALPRGLFDAAAISVLALGLGDSVPTRAPSVARSLRGVLPRLSVAAAKRHGRRARKECTAVAVAKALTKSAARERRHHSAWHDRRAREHVIHHALHAAKPKISAATTALSATVAPAAPTATVAPTPRKEAVAECSRYGPAHHLVHPRERVCVEPAAEHGDLTTVAAAVATLHFGRNKNLTTVLPGTRVL